ncbi:MAG: dTMP kinase [Chloroherpetonaceae bacterium]|nr:dTMP kinase [Chthonomonadaceae bacterium]MDW8209341.1 dTMP kinase [Chloroherpetonaceae bacterium]
MTGLFVTFEGVEGAGKTTQVARLRDALERDGYCVTVTREPGGDTLAEGVRALLLCGDVTPRAELLLFLAARAQNTERIIRPCLAQGHIVLCDRFIDSSVAYQGVARGLGRDVVARLNAFATAHLTPDITFLLDLPPEQGLLRIRQEQHDRIEAEGLDFHIRVREGFLAEAQKNSHRFRILDANLPPDALHREILQHVYRVATGRHLRRREESEI